MNRLDPCKWRLAAHARERMAEMKLSAQQLNALLNNPECVEKDSERGKYAESGHQLYKRGHHTAVVTPPGPRTGQRTVATILYRYADDYTSQKPTKGREHRPASMTRHLPTSPKA